MKKFFLLILATNLLISSCSSTGQLTPNSLEAGTKKTAKDLGQVYTSSGASRTIFESFPETQANASLEDKYDLQKYIESNNILQDIPVSPVDNYKVRFTSDGGAVFSVKADTVSPDYIWKRTPQKLVFDNFQLVNISGENENTKYYSRYSQLIENEITVNAAGQDITKKETLVQTVGLSLKKENLSYRIENYTPVVIRQVEKNSLPYKIEKLSLSSESTTEINIDGDKTLIPWPGLSFNSFQGKKLKLTVTASAAQERNLAVLISIEGSQFQLTKGSENTFTTEIDLPDLKTGKNGLIIELIDQKSLEAGNKFQGYTWIVPFIIN